MHPSPEMFQNFELQMSVTVVQWQCYFRLSPGGFYPPPPPESQIPPEKHSKHEKHSKYANLPPDMCFLPEPGV